MHPKQVPVSPLVTSLHRWSNKSKLLSFQSIAPSFNSDTISIADFKRDFLKDVISSNIVFDIATNSMLPRELLYQFTIVKMMKKENDSNMVKSIHDSQNLVVVPTITNDTILGKKINSGVEDDRGITKRRFFYFSPSPSMIQYYQDATNDDSKQRKKGVLKRTTFKDRLIGYDSNFRLRWRDCTNDFIILKTLQSMTCKLKEIELQNKDNDEVITNYDNSGKHLDCFGYGSLNFNDNEDSSHLSILNGIPCFNLYKLEKSLNEIYSNNNIDQKMDKSSKKFKQNLKSKFDSSKNGKLIIETFHTFKNKLKSVTSIKSMNDYEMNDKKNQLIMLSFMSQLFKLCIFLDI